MKIFQNKNGLPCFVIMTHYYINNKLITYMYRFELVGSLLIKVIFVSEYTILLQFV